MVPDDPDTWYLWDIGSRVQDPANDWQHCRIDVLHRVLHGKVPGIPRVVVECHVVLFVPHHGQCVTFPNVLSVSSSHPVPSVSDHAGQHAPATYRGTIEDADREGRAAIACGAASPR